MTDWLLAHGDDLQVALFFALFALLAVVERWWPGRPGSLARRSRWPANLFLTLVNLIALGALPISLVGAAVWARAHHFGLLNRLALPAAVVVAATLALRGFVSFGTHWLMHTVPVFWRVHRVHHLDTELDVTTTVRFHPLEFVIALVPGVPLVVLLGLSPWVLAAYELLDVLVTLWTHANLRLPPAVERIVRYAIVTPDLHRVHHSAWQPETDSNFGAVFPLWDLVFGTFRATPSVPIERMTLGLEEVRGRDAQRPIWLLTSVLARTLAGRTPPTP